MESRRRGRVRPTVKAILRLVGWSLLQGLAGMQQSTWIIMPEPLVDDHDDATLVQCSNSTLTEPGSLMTNRVRPDDSHSRWSTTMVTMVNKFTVSDDPDKFAQVWEASSEFMRSQPGFINFRLVRSVSDPSVFFNISDWLDAESHHRVLGSNAFQDHIAELAAVAVPEPNMCEVVIEYSAPEAAGQS
jgi:quinol monooxygenase YgiN